MAFAYIGFAIFVVSFAQKFAYIFWTGHCQVEKHFAMYFIRIVNGRVLANCYFYSILLHYTKDECVVKYKYQQEKTMRIANREKTEKGVNIL